MKIENATITTSTRALMNGPAVMAGDTKDALLESGTPLTVRVTSPVTLTIER